MASQSYERELGAVQERLKHLAKAQEDFAIESKAHRQETQEKLDGISSTLSLITSKFDQMSGAWKATTLIAGIAGVAGSLAWSAAKLILAIPLR
jgi:hypothetical protein